MITPYMTRSGPPELIPVANEADCRKSQFSWKPLFEKMRLANPNLNIWSVRHSGEKHQQTIPAVGQ